MQFGTVINFKVSKLEPFDPTKNFFVRFDPVVIKYLGQNFMEIIDRVICPSEDPCEYKAITLSLSAVGPEFYNNFGERCVVSFSLIWSTIVSQTYINLGLFKKNGTTTIFVVRNAKGHLYSVGVFWYNGGWNIRAYPFVPKGERVRRWFAGNQIIVKDPKFLPSPRSAR